MGSAADKAGKMRGGPSSAHAKTGPTPAQSAQGKRGSFGSSSGGPPGSQGGSQTPGMGGTASDPTADTGRSPAQ